MFSQVVGVSEELVRDIGRLVWQACSLGEIRLYEWVKVVGLRMCRGFGVGVIDRNGDLRCAEGGKVALSS